MAIGPWRAQEQTVRGNMAKAADAKIFSYYIIADNHNDKKY